MASRQRAWSSPRTSSVSQSALSSVGYVWRPFDVPWVFRSSSSVLVNISPTYSQINAPRGISSAACSPHPFFPGVKNTWNDDTQMNIRKHAWRSVWCAEHMNIHRMHHIARKRNAAVTIIHRYIRTQGQNGVLCLINIAVIIEVKIQGIVKQVKIERNRLAIFTACLEGAD